MKKSTSKSLELFYQFVKTRLKDQTYIFDDEEAVVEYEVELNRKGQVDSFGAPMEPDETAGIHIDAVVLVGPDGQLTDEDILPILPENVLNDIRTEIASNLN